MSPQFIRMGLHSTGYATRRHVKRNRQRASGRRVVLPGFPWESRFKTPEEIADYFGGEVIVCLLCGKTYRRLGGHLLPIHGLTEDQYRERFGLPWQRGLTSAKARGRYRAAIGARVEAGWSPPTADMAAMRAAPQRKKAPYWARLATGNLGNAAAGAVFDEEIKAAAKGHEWVMRLLSSPEAARVLGVSSINAMNLYMRNHRYSSGHSRPPLRTRWQKWTALSLVEQGWSQAAVAEVVGRTPGTVNQLCVRARKVRANV